MLAAVVDAQVAEILAAIDMPGPVFIEMMREAVERVDVDLAALEAQRHRLARAYADSAFEDTEYEHRMMELRRRIASAMPAEMPAIETAAALLRDVPRLWSEPTHEERRVPVAPLIDQVHVDVDAPRIVGFAAVPGLRTILERAVA